MPTRPDADAAARVAIGFGGLIVAGSMFASEGEWLWHLNAAFFIFVGLYALPPHPAHYVLVQDLEDNPAAGSAPAYQDEEPIDQDVQELHPPDDEQVPSTPQELTGECVAPPISELFGAALEAKTADNLVAFADFCARFRRFPSFNARLIQVQRPGAAVAGSATEWASVGRSIAPDATPIIILRRFGPVERVYELEDTLPPQEKLIDPFPVVSGLSEEALAAAVQRLISACKKQKSYRVQIVSARLGSRYAGSAASQGSLPMSYPSETVTIAHDLIISEPAEWKAPAPAGRDVSKGPIPHFRVRVNDRLSAGQQLITIAHELGHIFCGHLGACASQAEHGAWPDRISLGFHEREMEAEAVAWLVGKRASIISGSAAYLRHHVERGDTLRVDPDVVARAVGRIESLAALSYSARQPNH